MDPLLYDLLEPAVIFATLLGVAFGVKRLIWGKGSIQQIRHGRTDHGGANRIAELEERVRQLSDVVLDQSRRLEEHDERLDFAERMLTRERTSERKELEPPRE